MCYMNCWKNGKLNYSNLLFVVYLVIILFTEILIDLQEFFDIVDYAGRAWNDTWGKILCLHQQKRWYDSKHWKAKFLQKEISHKPTF